VKPIDSAFHSALAPWLRDFVLEKRAVGYRYTSEQYWLGRLDRHLLEQGHREATLPRALLTTWLARTAHESAKTQAARVVVLRQLARFLQRHGVLVDLPPNPPRALRGARFVARIFSPDEIVRLLAAVDRMPPDARAPQRHRVMPALFRVLYGCGLRLGEALRLRVQDVDLAEGVFTIREGKFRKDRLVPMAASLQAHLQRYHADMGVRIPDAVFFLAPHGGVYSQHAPYTVFRWMLRSAKIPHGGRGRGPRVHDLRHTFAVRRLEAWYREGADLGAKLPVLSTYLGHESIAGTQRYLQLTASLRPDLSARLEQQYGALIPRRERA
jgi:integrase/recombinase XerD